MKVSVGWSSGTNASCAIQSEFLCYRQYAVTSVVDPVLFWKLNLPDWPLLSQASLNILGFPVASANLERAFSKLRDVNRKERAAMTDAGLSSMLASTITNCEK